MDVRIEASWKAQLEGEFAQPYWERLTAFVKAEYAAGPCCPPGKTIFRAFDLTPFEQVKVVILGQDPYHGPDQAQGLAFSVHDGQKVPPSLRNMLVEVASDLGRRGFLGEGLSGFLFEFDESLVEKFLGVALGDVQVSLAL